MLTLKERLLKRTSEYFGVLAIALLLALPVHGDEHDATPIAGKTLTASVGGDEPITWTFGEDGKVFAKGGEAGEGFEGTYRQYGQDLHINMGVFEFEAIYDGENLIIGGAGDPMFFETDLVPSPVKYDILLPPNYKSTDKTYPLLFWLHGGGGGGGHLPGSSQVFKRMWAAGTLSELVVVTPHAGTHPTNYLDFKDGSQRWETFITGEFLTHLRANYRVSKDRSGTFIGGISMGGYGALKTGLKHPDKFGAILAYEPMINPSYDWEDDSGENVGLGYGEPFDEDYWVVNNPAAIVRDNADAIRDSGIRLYIEVGSEDAFEFHRGTHFLHKALYERGIRHEYRYVDGADHVGDTIPGRYRDGLSFLNRVINPPPPDPQVEAFRRWLDSL